MKTLHEINNALSIVPTNTIGGVAFAKVKKIFADARAITNAAPDDEESVAAPRAELRELAAIKHAVAFLCANGAGDARYSDAVVAGVIPVADHKSLLPGQAVLSDENTLIMTAEFVANS